MDSIDTDFISVCAQMHAAFLDCAGRIFHSMPMALPCPLQAVANLQKRREGAPKSGKVSFVVTDIESYSGKDSMNALPHSHAHCEHLTLSEF